MNLQDRETFEAVVAAATSWIESQERIAFQQGRALDQNEMVLAKRVGVKRPEQIRLYVVDVVPVPTEGILGDFAGPSKEPKGGWEGLTCRYGVFVRRDRLGTNTVPHEFRHVAQYEALGSVGAFACFYLREIDFFGYGNGPLERDAKLAETV